MTKEVFKEKLQYGDEEWIDQPYNGSPGQPCLYGCILKQRVKPPHDYRPVGDCRVPWAEDCCLNRQDKQKDAK